MVNGFFPHLIQNSLQQEVNEKDKYRKEFTITNKEIAKQILPWFRSNISFWTKEAEIEKKINNVYLNLFQLGIKEQMIHNY